jgi:cytochrome c oxidase cbb3-type subunit III
MHIRNALLAAAFVGLTIAVTHGAADQAQQTPPAQTPPAQTPPAAPPPQTPPPEQPQPQPQPGAAQGPGRGGQGRGRGPGVFPAMQRPPADPAVLERGRTLFTATCSACHGADARGGQLNGPNLLRSQLVLADKDGELIGQVVQNGRPERGMPAFPLPAEDIKAISEFIHSLTGASRGQGAPPESDAPPPDIVVGDAAAGETYFAAKCSTCHSATGDLQGIASRTGDPKMLQNAWVSGGLTTGGRGGGRRGTPPGEIPGPAITATVTQPSGEKVQGRLIRYDDFVVTLLMEDGSLRSIRREGDRTKLEIKNPLEGHKALLAVLTDKDMRNVTAYLVTLK